MTVQEQLWQYFIKKGFTPQSIAGIMGNVDEESKFQPNAVQKNNLYTNASYTNMVDTGIYNKYGLSWPCWYYTDYHAGHGWLNVSGAIQKSCNYLSVFTSERHLKN